MVYSREELEQVTETAAFWWHSIDLGDMVVTPGRKSADVLAAELEALQLPDLRGKTVLDIGAWDGYFSFEAERLGAARVVALDHWAWSVDLAAVTRKDQVDPATLAKWAEECRTRGTHPWFRPNDLPGRRGFDTAHRARRSKVEAVVGDFMRMDLSALGKFDVVLYLGVLYHQRNPLEAMRRVAAVTRELAIVETHAVVIPEYEETALCAFYPFNELDGDGTNWWSPNRKALHGLCQAVGFPRVTDLTPPPIPEDPQPLKLVPYRAMVHAWKGRDVEEPLPWFELPNRYNWPAPKRGGAATGKERGTRA